MWTRKQAMLYKIVIGGAFNQDLLEAPFWRQQPILWPRQVTMTHRSWTMCDMVRICFCCPPEVSPSVRPWMLILCQHTASAHGCFALRSPCLQQVYSTEGQHDGLWQVEESCCCKLPVEQANPVHLWSQQIMAPRAASSCCTSVVECGCVIRSCTDTSIMMQTTTPL